MTFELGDEAFRQLRSDQARLADEQKKRDTYHSRPENQVAILAQEMSNFGARVCKNKLHSWFDLIQFSDWGTVRQVDDGTLLQAQLLQIISSPQIQIVVSLRLREIEGNATSEPRPIVNFCGAWSNPAILHAGEAVQYSPDPDSQWAELVQFSQTLRAIAYSDAFGSEAGMKQVVGDDIIGAILSGQPAAMIVPA